MGANPKRTQAEETQGGFNPDRPREKEMPQVGLMPTDDPNKRVQGKMSRIDPALKSTPKEKPAPEESDEYPNEGAVRHRGDENDHQEP